MVLLNGSNIKKMFLDETLFDGVSFNVEEGDKIGFVGVNGAGKSTLFRILNGTMDYDSGELFKNKFTKIGYLDQYTCVESDKTIMGEMLTAFEEVIAVENELDEVRLMIESGADGLEELVNRQTALQERFEKLDGYQYRSRIRSALIGLGFSEEDFEKRVDSLSGGQKT